MWSKPKCLAHGHGVMQPPRSLQPRLWSTVVKARNVLRINVRQTPPSMCYLYLSFLTGSAISLLDSDYSIHVSRFGPSCSTFVVMPRVLPAYFQTIMTSSELSQAWQVRSRWNKISFEARHIEGHSSRKLRKWRTCQRASAPLVIASYHVMPSATVY